MDVLGLWGVMLFCLWKLMMMVIGAHIGVHNIPFSIFWVNNIDYFSFYELIKSQFL